jgi:DNA-binding beta-propeller fold protein YncE
MVRLPGSPFGVAVSHDDRWAFVASGTSVGVLSLRSAKPRVVHEVPIGKLTQGVAPTPDDRFLLAANLLGVTVIDTARLERGQSKVVVGVLSSTGLGALEVAVSPDGRYAFIPLEGSAELAVFNVQRALTRGFGRADLVGTVPLEQGPVGIAVAADGRYLYVTSEVGARGSSFGTLTTIDLKRAETDPAGAVVSTVPAGCSPVRVVASRTSVYVTARESNALLQFSAQSSYPRRAKPSRRR